MHQQGPSESLRALGDGTSVLVQPNDSVVPVLDLIESARSSVFIKQFTFTHAAILEAVIEAHRAGRDVRIMLNPHRSSGDRANDEAFATLEAAGVKMQWSNPAFAVTHEKSMVVDGSRGLIATFNFCEKYFTHTRDYGVLTEEADEVAQIRDCFLADWDRHRFEPRAGSALLWSNRNSRRIMSLFIDQARHTLDVQHPKFVDATILDRIVQARRRGVRVRVLCGGRHGISDWDVLDTFSSLRVLGHLDVRVRKQKNLRLHAKLLIADERTGLIGSMNIDRSAFDQRRELGAVIAGKAALHRLRKVFEDDWQDAHRYEPPDPLLSHLHPEDDFPHDPDLHHE